VGQLPTLRAKHCFMILSADFPELPR